MQKESQVVEIRPDDIVLEQEIGRGSFAKVYRGKCRGQTVAIKVLHTQTFTEQVLQAFREEIAVMSQIHHPNLVLFMGACTIPGQLMIVTELMPRNLESVFLGKTGKHKRVALVQKLKMAKDAALGMNWLHKSTPMFIHRDFKLSNLLVDENYNVKVCDFGLTKMKSQANDSLHDTKGSPLYMAPEVFTGSYSEKCDVYSFGLSFWEIINERRVFPRYENNLEALIKSRCENYETPPITDDMLPRLVSLLKRCWDKDPNLRPPFDVVVKELEEIIIEQCITDERGRDVWKKASKGEDKVTWDKLARAVCISVGKVALPESYRSDRQMQCLKVLLCRQSEPNTVHAEKFGKVLAWFGPYSDGRDASNRGRTFLDRIEETLSQKWFHGELSTQDAEERLDNRRPGTFLVRFSSSEKGAFTVSGLDKDRKKSHQRVVYHPSKGVYVMPDETIYPTLLEAINDLCRASKLRHPCPGSRYSKYFSEEPQPTSKNIALVKEEIKQLQLIHLNEICEVPDDKDTSLDTTIDTASAGRAWGVHHPHHHQSGPLDGQRSPFHTGSMHSSIHSSGTWGGSTGGGILSGLIGTNAGGDSNGNQSSIRIAPYIPPAMHSAGNGNTPSPYHAGGPGGHHSSGPSAYHGTSASTTSASTIHAALAANKAAATAAAAMSYRQSPYTHASTHATTHASTSASKYPSLTYSPHPLNSAELYYSAPMTGMKNASNSSFFTQFASTKHSFRSKDVLTAPLKNEEKKRGLFSRLKRGVTGKDKDRDNYRDRDDGSDLSDSSVSSTWSGKSGKLSTKVNNNNSGGKKSKKEKRNNNSLGKKGHGRDRDHHHHKDDKDFNPDDPHGYHRGTGDNGGGTSDDDSMDMYASPYVPSVTTDSTTASTNSIPAHVLVTLQKAEDERMRKRINGNYDSDSSTEDLFPPYQPSSATSATSSYIKRTIEEKARHLQHLVGGGEVQEEEEEAEEEAERDGSEEDDGEDEDNDESDNEGEKRPKKSKAKESSRVRKEDKERRRREKAAATSTEDKKQRRKDRAALKEATTAADDASKERKRTKPTINIPVAVITRPSSASSSSAPMSLASTAPPGLMEAALLNAPRPRRERKPEHRSTSRKAAEPVQVQVNGRVAGEEGLPLDQVIARTSTTPSPREALVVGALGNSKESTTKHAGGSGKKEKKRRGGDADGSPTSTGDEAETVSVTSSVKKEKKEKKSKKEKSSKGMKDSLQRRQPPASQRATTSASSDMTGGEDEDETSEKEQNDPQGKKKKNKDEERTVIAVF